MARPMLMGAFVGVDDSRGELIVFLLDIVVEHASCTYVVLSRLPHSWNDHNRNDSVTVRLTRINLYRCAFTTHDDGGGL